MYSNSFVIWGCLILMQTVLRTVALEWPAGTYGLPQAQSGCPSSVGFQWKTGYRFQDLSDIEPKTTARSSSLHLAANINNNNVRRDFCIKLSTSSDTGRPNWPKGKYCIYRRGGSCPAGFSSGWIKWDDYDHFNSNSKGGYLPDGTYNDNTIIYYCCRGDGDKKEPISLPSDKDFFLFPYQSSECQKVKWFIDTTEWINYDTHSGWFEKNGEGGAYPYKQGSTDHKIFYCYYKRCQHTYTATSGSFTSPYHPGTYPAGQYCSWRITVSSNRFVKLTFTSFNLEDSVGCSADYVAVYDGKDDSSPLISKYCGSTIPGNVLSTARTMFIVLKTDKQNNMNGFSASYVTQIPPTTLPATTAPPPTTTPNPTTRNPTTVATQPVTNSTEKTTPTSTGGTTIGSNTGTVVTPTNESTTPSNKPTTPVVITTGNPTTKSNNSTTSPPEVTTTQPDTPKDYTLWPGGHYGLPEADHGCPLSDNLSWETGYRYQDTDNGRMNNRSDNFHLDAFVGENVRRSFCIKTNTSLDYKRPDWPKGVYCIYQKNGSCPVGLTSGWVLWDDEDKEQGETNNNDAGGTLPDGEYHSDTKIYFCCRDDGDKNTPITLPPEDRFYLLAYKSAECQKVKWTIESLEYIQYKTESTSGSSDTGGTFPYGASAKDHKMHYCYHKGCKQILKDQSGEFTSPLYPLSYPSKQHCSWTITPDNVSAIHLNFTSFSMASSAECTADSLIVYDGVDDTTPLIGQYCGGSPPPEEGIKSSGPAVYLLFISDDVNSFTGFKVDYKPANATPTIAPSTSSPTTEEKISTTTETDSGKGPVEAQTKNDDESTNVAAVVVPVIFILLILMIIIALAYIWHKRKRQNPKDDQSLMSYFRSLSLSNLMNKERADQEKEIQFAIDNPLYDTGECLHEGKIILSAENAAYDC